MQFGIPMTIISGGISAIKKDSFQPINPILPIAQITAIPTTVKQIPTTRKDLKKIFSEYLHQKNDYFNQSYVNQLYDEHQSGTHNHQFKLLRIFAINYWLKKHGN